MKKYSIVQAADQYVKYDMIQAHTQVPSYSEPRLQLLNAMLNQSKLMKDKSELYALVTALVQLGMDTHDLIDIESGFVNEKQMRSRQLNVLAGDYFSAKFYQLLAAVGEIELIGKLSKAVSDVNRLKVAFYEKIQLTGLSSEEYISNRILLKSELFKPFQRYLEPSIQHVWQPLLENVTRFEVIHEELTNISNAGGYLNSYAYWRICEGFEAKEREAKTYEQLQQLYVQQNIQGALIDKLHMAMQEVQQTVYKHVDLMASLQHLLNDMNAKLMNYTTKRVEAN